MEKNNVNPSQERPGKVTGTLYAKGENVSTPFAAPKNTPARIVETHDTPTDIESVSQQSRANSQKLLLDG